MGRREGSAPAFRGESMCLGRAPSVTRKRDRKVKGMEGRVETDKALLSSYYGLGISPWSICTLFGIVGFFGFRSWDWRRNVWAQEGRAWRKHVLWIIGKGGGIALSTSHVFLESLKQGQANTVPQDPNCTGYVFPKTKQRIRGERTGFTTV
jgi:hypothetical protein